MTYRLTMTDASSGTAYLADTDPNPAELEETRLYMVELAANWGNHYTLQPDGSYRSQRGDVLTISEVTP